MARAPKTARLLAAGSTPTLLRQEVKHQSQDWLSLLRPISLRVAHLSQTFLFCCLLHPHVAPARILTSLSTFASGSTTTSSSLPGSATSLHRHHRKSKTGTVSLGTKQSSHLVFVALFLLTIQTIFFSPSLKEEQFPPSMSVDTRQSLNCLRFPSRFETVSRSQLSKVHTGDLTRPIDHP